MCTKKFIFQRQESLTAPFQYPLISILFLIISSIVLSFNHIVLKAPPTMICSNPTVPDTSRKLAGIWR